MGRSGRTSFLVILDASIAFQYILIANGRQLRLTPFLYHLSSQKAFWGKHPFRTLLIVMLVSFIIGLTRPALALSNEILLLHNINVQPAHRMCCYDVAFNFSLLDTTGYWIEDATAEDFSLTEGGSSF